MYLTYDEYKSLGGKVEESAFPNLERKAERKLDYFTQNRLKSATIIPDEVKECLTEFVDRISKSQNGDKVASFSNGSVSVSFENDGKTDDDLLHDIAVEYLPIELITMAVM